MKDHAKKATDDAQFLDTAQLASRWHIHAETVRRRIRGGELPATRIGRKYLVALEDVEKSEAASGMQSWARTDRS